MQTRRKNELKGIGLPYPKMSETECKRAYIQCKKAEAADRPITSVVPVEEMRAQSQEYENFEMVTADPGEDVKDIDQIR